jgi:hypothetical protein
MANAESGTDYDKAKVVADRDPSLFWLAVDILGAVGSVAAPWAGAGRSLGTSRRCETRPWERRPRRWPGSSR